MTNGTLSWFDRDIRGQVFVKLFEKRLKNLQTCFLWVSNSYLQVFLTH